MPTTTNYGFYSPPLTGVTPNVPRDVKTLADAVDVALKAEETARIASATNIQGERSHAAALSVASSSSVWVTVPFDTSVLNEIPWNGTTNLFTVPTAGYYQIHAAASFVANATASRGIRLLLNGSTLRHFLTGAAASGVTGVAINKGAKLAAGDTIQVQVLQNSGSALALSGGTNYNQVEITRTGLA